MLHLVHKNDKCASQKNLTPSLPINSAFLCCSRDFSARSNSHESRP